MKFFSTLLLAVSLTLNAFVVFLFFRGESAPTSAVPAPSIASRDASASSADADAWRDLQTDDLPTLVSRLRASGFPPAIIRAILAAEIEEGFAARRKAITVAAEQLPFWKNQPNDPKQMLALRQLEREQQQRLHELLGDDASPDDVLNRVSERSALGFLSQDKADTILRMMRDFEDRRMDLFATGVSYATDRNAFKALETELHDAVARFLSPEELFEYDLRRSNTADSLRDRLSAFKPTEEEFRAIYKLQAAFDQRYSEDFLLPPDQRKQYDQASTQLSTDIKNLLGPDRGAEYERATDYNYRRTSQLVDRLELPAETTDALWAVKKEFEKRRTDIYRSVREPDQLRDQLTVLQQEAVARVTPMLGDARYLDTYKQYGGNWLQNLPPRPPPTNSPPK